MGTEHWFIIPINSLNHRKVPDVNMEIVQNFYNAYSMPKSFLLRNISMVGIPKSTVLVIIFRVFMWPLSLINAVPWRIIHLQYFEMVSQKGQDHLLQARWTMEFLLHPLILQWHPGKIKFAVPSLNPNEKYSLYLKAKDDALFKNRSKIPAFVLKPLKDMLNLVVYTISLQQL